MPRKQAGGAPKSPSKAKARTATPSASGTPATSASTAPVNGAGTTDASAGSAAAGRQQTAGDGQVPSASWKFRLFFLIIPLFQMLFTAEAPRRPFSALRSRQTGELLTQPSPEDPSKAVPIVIDPRILFVISQPSDVLFFSPTISILLGKERRDKCEVFVLGLSNAGGGEAREEWKGALDALGIEQGNRVLLDVPSLAPSNPHWDPKDVAEAVTPIVVDFGIDTVLTFDTTGPSFPRNPHHAAIYSGLSTLIVPSGASPSQPLASALSKAENGNINPTYPRLYALQTPDIYTKHLALLSPILEHFTLAYHAIVGEKTFLEFIGLSKFLFPDEKEITTDGTNDENAERKKRPTIIFISEIRTYLSSLKALGAVISGFGPEQLFEAVKLVTDKMLWVNEWEEIVDYE